MFWRGSLAAALAASVALTALACASAFAAERTVNPAHFPRPHERPRQVLPTPPDVKIALLLAGGRYAAASDDIADGLAVALAEAGQAIRGHRIVVLREDGDGSLANATERAKRLLAENAVDVLVGPATPVAMPALRDLADGAHVPLVVPVPGAAVLAGVACSPYVLHLAPSGDQVAGPFGSWAASRGRVKQVYLLAPEDKAARSQVAAFKRMLVAAGAEVVGEEYVSQSNPDFSPYLAKLRLMGADSIYAPFSGESAATFVRQYEALGLAKQRITLFGAAAVQSAPDGGAIGAVDYVPALDTPENRRFQVEFAKAHGRPPSEHAARGYDAGRLIVEALRANAGRADDHALFAAKLADVSFTGPRGPVRADPRRGSALDHLYIVRARDGEDGPRYELLDRVPPAAGAAAATCTAAREG